MALDPKDLPEDPKVLQQMVLDLIAQLDRECTERNKIEALLRELLNAKRNRKSERVGFDPFVWLKDTLSRIADHPINRLAELLPHNWTPAQA